jgi:hypothetical protein
LSKYLSTADFLAGITGKPEDFDLPGVGLIQVRSLTTAESGEMNRKHSGDGVALMLATVRMGLVQPALDDTQLQLLESAKPGVIQVISHRIMELSGIVETKAELDELEKKAGPGS